MALTTEEIQARIAARSTPLAPKVDDGYKYIRDFSAAADTYVDMVVNEEGRWMFGMTELDAMIRGVGRGELMYVTGRAHSGKTQVVLQSVANNPNAHVLMFTPDEVDILILAKLVGITRGVSAEDIERRVRDGDEHTIAMIKHVAAVDFKNLIVIDQALTFDQMSVALQEAEHYWGCPADVVLIDFLELLPGSADHSGVAAISKGLKAWGKVHQVPVVCLHQASRSSGKRGQAAGMDAMRYGGETEAIYVAEVYRKREDDSDAYEAKRHENTVTVNLTKNKRPPCRIGEVDLYLDPACGVVRTLRPGDMLNPGTPASSPQEAMAAAMRIREQRQVGTFTLDDVDQSADDWTHEGVD